MLLENSLQVERKDDKITLNYYGRFDLDEYDSFGATFNALDYDEGIESARKTGVAQIPSIQGGFLTICPSRRGFNIGLIDLNHHYFLEGLKSLDVFFVDETIQQTD